MTDTELYNLAAGDKVIRKFSPYNPNHSIPLNLICTVTDLSRNCIYITGQVDDLWNIPIDRFLAEFEVVGKLNWDAEIQSLESIED